MSIVRSFSVMCDGEEAPGHPCPAWTGDVTDDTYGSASRQARREARGAGWVARRRDGRLVDLCPECAAADAPDST